MSRLSQSPCRRRTISRPPGLSEGIAGLSQVQVQVQAEVWAEVGLGVLVDPKAERASGSGI